MSHAISSSQGRIVYIDNAAAWEKNALVADRLQTLPIASIQYAPDKVAIDKPIMTESEMWYAQRMREYHLIKRLYTTDARIAHRQLCVFVKRDNMHKRLVACIMHTPKGNVWFDVTPDCKITPRGTIGYRKVSESIARQLLGIDDDTTKVYMQAFKEVLHEHAHRMQDKRRYYEMMHDAPRDRRVGEYLMPANYGQRKAESQEIADSLEDAYLYRKWG